MYIVSKANVPNLSLFSYLPSSGSTGPGPLSIPPGPPNSCCDFIYPSNHPTLSPDAGCGEYIVTWNPFLFWPSFKSHLLPLPTFPSSKPFLLSLSPQPHLCFLRWQLSIRPTLWITQGPHSMPKLPPAPFSNHKILLHHSFLYLNLSF